jgi:putative transcriptional regulator
MFHKFNTLRNSMLIAMPTLKDDYFSDSVILLCEHDHKGAMGLVINRPLDINLSEIMQQMKIANNNPTLQDTLVLAGGPVKTEKGFILHYNDLVDSLENQEWKSNLELTEHLTITTSNDIMHAIANNQHPEPFIFTLGYCEWQPGQLEDELISNSWLIAPLDLNILFNVPYMNRWRECTYNIGINDINNLSSYTGHA